MWPNPQFLADLVTFAEETLNGKLYFLCSGFNIPGGDHFILKVPHYSSEHTFKSCKLNFNNIKQ